MLPPLYELEDLQTVATFTSPWEAQLAKAALESEGIEVMIADENLIRLYWALSNAIGGVKVQVRPEDLERARELLANCQPLPEIYLLGEDDEASVRCPECRSENVEFERWSRLGFIGSWVLFGVPVPIPTRRWICRKCGLAWRPEAAVPLPLQSPVEEHHPDLVTVARFTTPWMAHLARTRLESAGVEACVFEERFPPVNLLTGAELALNRVAVQAADEDLAREILAEELEEPAADRFSV
jgi:rubredoxin